MTRPPMPLAALAVGEWTGPLLAAQQQLVTMTERAVGLAIQNEVLRAQLTAATAAPLGPAHVPAPEAPAAAAPDDPTIHEVLDNLANQVDAIAQERDDWRQTYEAAALTITQLEEQLQEQATKHHELAAEWEKQGARIVELEAQLAKVPERCPCCDEPLARDDAPAETPRSSLIKRCAGGGCKNTFPKNGAQKYCEACRPPRRSA